MMDLSMKVNGTSWMRRGVVALACASMMAAPLPTLAQTGELSDLVYQRDDYSSRELPKRGCVLTYTDNRGDKVWQ